MDLNERQEAVASTQEGRLVVLAGPGSGKTRVAVERIRRMLKNGEHPREVWAVTFTVRAAAELEERLERTIGFAGTIHGLARRILTEFPDADHALGSYFSVLDGSPGTPQSRDSRRRNDVDDLMNLAHRDAKLKTKIGLLRSRIGEAAVCGSLPDEDSTIGLEARKLLLAYSGLKARLRAEDFDGLVARASRVLRENPLVAQEVRRRTKHLTVDEAQDLDATQDAFLELVSPSDDALPGTGRSRMLVGDVLQSIYGWRGGTPEILLRHAAAAHTVVNLVTNYRSVPGIVDLSNRVASDDPIRPDGYVLDAARPAGEVEAVSAPPPFATDVDEVEAVAGIVARAAEVHGFKGVAVLARTNATLAGVARVLASRDIPHQVLGARRERLQQEELRGAIAYARLALNTADDFALLHALRCPARPSLKEDPKFEDRLRDAAAGASLWAGLSRFRTWAKQSECDALEFFHGQIESLRAAFVGGAESDGWHRALDDLFGFLAGAHAALGLETRAIEIQWLRGVLDAFVAGTRPGTRRWNRTARGFLWWILHGQGAGEHDPEADAVTLSTVHLAKGLEWPVVIIPGLVEDVFPSSQSIEAAACGEWRAMHEELRCFFVASTRARDRLVLLGCSTVSPVWGGLPFRASPSRFLRYAGPGGPVV